MLGLISFLRPFKSVFASAHRDPIEQQVRQIIYERIDELNDLPDPLPMSLFTNDREIQELMKIAWDTVDDHMPRNTTSGVYSCSIVGSLNKQFGINLDMYDSQLLEGYATIQDFVDLTMEALV